MSLEPIPPVVEDFFSDSNASIITSDDPTSPALKPQGKSKATTHLSIEHSLITAYSSSSGGSSIKSVNAISNTIEIGSSTKEMGVDDLLIGLINRANSNVSNSSEPSSQRLYSGTSAGKSVFHSQKSPLFTVQQDNELSEGEALEACEECLDSDSSSEWNKNAVKSIKVSYGHSRNLDGSALSLDTQHSGYQRKYLHEDPQSTTWARHRKHFFILSSAGKPIYTRYGDESRISSYMGVIQAIVSFFADADDSLRCINAGQHKFVFLLKEPLYLVAVSRTNESESQLRDQLNYMYNQILSVLTSVQLTKIFEQRINFDLRRLLGGTEIFLDNLATGMSDDPGFMLGSIQCVRMSKELRDKVGATMQPVKSKDLLYAMLITNNKLITLLRPRRHSLHPADLHLIFNTINGSSTFKSAESWIPICLPKFNNKGFLHAYVSYIVTNVCLLLISPDHDNFFELSKAKSKIIKQLSSTTALKDLENAILNNEYSIADVGVPGLRHFIYKTKQHVQYTSSEFARPYNTPREKRKLFKLYRYTHDRMHSRIRPLKVHYYVSPSETILGWTTASFELYAAFGPMIPKSAVIASANGLLRWIKKEEDTLFILHSP
ncbi:9388_t:CDS:10, partial [Ambispora gerdemannii]